MQSHGVALFTNQAGTAVNGTAQKWYGGRGVFVAAGTFDGATVKLQFLGPDGVTWIDAGAATTLTAVGAGVFELPHGQIRGAITAGTSPVGIYARADRVPS